MEPKTKHKFILLLIIKVIQSQKYWSVQFFGNGKILPIFMLMMKDL